MATSTSHVVTLLFRSNFSKRFDNHYRLVLGFHKTLVSIYSVELGKHTIHHDDVVMVVEQSFEPRAMRTFFQSRKLLVTISIRVVINRFTVSKMKHLQLTL